MTTELLKMILIFVIEILNTICNTYLYWCVHNNLDVDKFLMILFNYD